MAQLPSDRTKLALAQSNQVPSAVASSQRNKDAITEAYDTIDLLHQFVQGLISTGTLSRLGIVNVKDFGAKGDGVTNDATAIQSAINSIESKGGGVLFFPDGTYMIGQQINLPLTVAISIVGNGVSSIIKASAPMTAMFYKGVGFTTGSRLLNIDLDANRNAQYCLWSEQANRFEIYGVHFWYFLKAGLRMFRTASTGDASCYESQVHHVKFTGLLPGVYTGTTEANMPDYAMEISSGATDNHFHDIVIRNVKTAGVYENGGNNMYARVHFFGFPEPLWVASYGFQLVTGRCLINQCYFDGSRIGIKAQQGFFSITGCSFFWRFDLTYPEQATNTGIEVDAAAGNYLIANNVFRGAVGYDIKFVAGFPNGSSTVFGNVSTSITNQERDTISRPVAFGQTISVQAVNAIGLHTMTRRGNLAELLVFDTDRAWRWRQSGTGSTAKLELHSDTSNKSFIITASDNSPAFEIFANDDATGPSRAYVDGMEVYHQGSRPEGRGNVGSGVGFYDFTFTTAQADANYGIIATPSWNAGAIWFTNITTTGFRVQWATAPASASTFVWQLVRN